MASYDLVIVGAGIHGLATLKTYRDVHPDASILVLEKGESIGGVWAKDRLYPSLRTNNHFKTFEFSGFPMSTKGYDLHDDHIPGEHVNEYLQQYAKEFNLLKHMRFNCKVDTAIDQGTEGWTLLVSQTLQGETSTFKIAAAKLIVVTGLTSQPLMPDLQGKDSFNAPIYHSSEFAKAEHGLGTFKKVALLSGAKFSWDIACAYASAGVQVDWIIRESGHGPCWMFPNRLTPLKVIPELLLQTRLITWLSPCIWDDGFSWIRNWFHQTWLGRKIVDAFFAKVQHSAEESNGYAEHPETAKLRPWDDVFFIGTNRGLLNYGRDFFKLVRNGTIRVHIADITRLSNHTIHLSDSSSITADVLICGTGWKDTPQLHFTTTRELGLPGHTSSSTAPHVAAADVEILRTCPKLGFQPTPRRGSKPPTPGEKEDGAPEPYRLYRFMVPPAFIQHRTLGFAGFYRSPATTLIAQAQALWLTAFFDGAIPGLIPTTNSTPDHSRIAYETALHTQFPAWRYSRGFGARFPELWFECLPYVDLLLRDVGLKHRRKGGWWSECMTPYGPGDYVGVVGEYLDGRRRDGKEKGRGVRSVGA
ncbi:FAD/NAD(P)-binding domain-containing protein [Pyrenochaeta sp. DS3sAY3a]|nr:FAD/NAD(P)-binding domain-containing protein [Pyrenochaeta sp. DS3sAY3a]